MMDGANALANGGNFYELRQWSDGDWLAARERIERHLVEVLAPQAVREAVLHGQIEAAKRVGLDVAGAVHLGHALERDDGWVFGVHGWLSLGRGSAGNGWLRTG